MRSHTMPRHHGVLTVVLGALTAFTPLSIDIYLPSLPFLQRDLGTSASAVQLTLAAFMAGLGLGQLVFGPLSDRYGRRRPLAAGMVLYILASAACALAPTIHWLIAFRFLQAIGGAAGPVIARAVVRDLYSGRDVARVLSLLTLILGVAPLLAPLLGGWILGIGGWRPIFGVLALFGVAGLICALLSLPRTEARPGQAARPEDLRASLRALLDDRRFIAATLTGGFSLAGMFAYISGAPFVMMEIYHISPRGFAWIFGLNAAGFICASQLNRRLLASGSPGRIAASATWVSCFSGAVLLVLAVTGALGVAAVASALFAFLWSIGFVMPNSTSLALEAHRARAGTASAVLGAAQYAVAAGTSSLLGLLNDGTVLPMAAVMSACAVAASVAGSAIAERGRTSEVRSPAPAA